MHRLLVVLLACIPLTCEAVEWHSSPPEPPRVTLYLFWSQHCPHCTEARQFIDTLGDESWLKIEQHEISQSADKRRLFADIAAAAHLSADAVPGFFYCGQGMTGFADAASTGKTLIDALGTCYQQAFGRPPPGHTAFQHQGRTLGNRISVPLAGEVDIDGMSLPVLTLVMASIDAINPCAFFVLLFLLSLLTHTRKRSRMLLVGIVFVLVSGIVYFLFMSAWLTLFTLFDHLSWLTFAAGFLAIVIGAINVKDFLWLKQGISLSLTDRRRAELTRRIRDLVQAQRTLTVLTATLLLAVAANSYELLCTAGFPMVYTRTLTLAALPAPAYYGYLALYNLIYILPLLGILTLYVYTLGNRKLSEREGRALKLLSGLMMIALGVALVLDPGVLHNPLMAVLLLGSAVVVTVTAMRLWPERSVHRSIGTSPPDRVDFRDR